MMLPKGLASFYIYALKYNMLRFVEKSFEFLLHLVILWGPLRNAWPPQASYPYGNFSDTSSFKLWMSVEPKFYYSLKDR